jgi:hypothetical protein
MVPGFGGGARRDVFVMAIFDVKSCAAASRFYGKCRFEIRCFPKSLQEYLNDETGRSLQHQ